MSRTAAFHFSVAHPRLAELLSYLQGLAPVGMPVTFKRKHAHADLECGTVRNIDRELAALIRRGLVARCAHELLPKRKALVVLKRLEDM